jgi:hypothetical protein
VKSNNSKEDFFSNIYSKKKVRITDLGTSVTISNTAPGTVNTTPTRANTRGKKARIIGNEETNILAKSIIKA